MRSVYQIFAVAVLTAQVAYVVYLGQRFEDLSAVVRNLQENSNLHGPGSGEPKTNAPLLDLNGLGEGNYGIASDYLNTPNSDIEELIGPKDKLSLARNIGELLGPPGTSDARTIQSEGVALDIGPFIPMGADQVLGIDSRGSSKETNIGEDQQLPN